MHEYLLAQLKELDSSCLMVVLKHILRNFGESFINLVQTGLDILETREEKALIDLAMTKTHLEIQKYNLGLGSVKAFMEQLDQLCSEEV